MKRQAERLYGHFETDMHNSVLWVWMLFHNTSDFSLTFVELKTKDSFQKHHGHRLK